jgi:hypothetical protein
MGLDHYVAKPCVRNYRRKVIMAKVSVELMSLSGMVEIPRVEAKRGFVMPALRLGSG